MKKYLIFGIILLATASTIGGLIRQNKKLRQDRDVYRDNMAVMFGDLEHYRTRSGEQAVRVGELQLRIGELEKYRTEDAALIRDMGIKKKELEQLTKIQQQTIYHLEGRARDTAFIEIVNEVPAGVPAKVAEYSDEWIDFLCRIFEDNRFEADITSRDRITYVERVEYARALGFLWRTKRVKTRDQSIVNHNPHAEIIDAEFITIRK